MTAPVPFIVGVPRSGTTMLRLMLDAHPEMAIPPETYFVTNLIEAGDGGAGAEQLANVLVGHRRWDDLGIDEGELRSRLAAIGRPSGGDAVRTAFELYAESRGKPRWGDKTPAYLTNLAEIHGALPEVRVVHIIRDGRDVVLSVMRMPEPDRPLRRPDTIGLAAKRWSKRIERARRQAERLPHYMEVRYEDLVTDPEPVLRSVCEFVELPWEAGMLDYHSAAGERLEEMNRALDARGGLPKQSAEGRVAPHALAAEPPKRDRVGVWRTEMTAEQLAEFEAEGGEMLRELGYEAGSDG
ncbi:MAG: sulfotransferase family protein [Solirubrobacterales bacterium]